MDDKAYKGLVTNIGGRSTVHESAVHEIFGGPKPVKSDQQNTLTMFQLNFNFHKTELEWQEL